VLKTRQSPRPFRWQGLAGNCTLRASGSVCCFKDLLPKAAAGIRCQGALLPQLGGGPNAVALAGLRSSFAAQPMAWWDLNKHFRAVS
jgi:hypothetical protein